MQFEIEQRLPGSPEAVEAALLEPRFWDAVADVATHAKPELLDQDDKGRFVHQRLRFRFIAKLPAAALAVLDPTRLTFVQAATIDRSTHTARFHIEPDYYAERLDAAGGWALRPTSSGSRRTYDFTLRVRFPLVGPHVERAILSGLEAYADQEEAVLERWLDGQASSG